MAKFSNLFGQADLWDSPDVDMAPIYTILGSASTEDQTTARTAFLNFATRSPTAFAITLAANTDRIYIAHAPTVYPARAGAATNHDNLAVALINDDADALLNITLPADAFSRSGEVRCVRKAAIEAGFANTPIDQHFGPHGSAAKHKRDRGAPSDLNR